MNLKGALLFGRLFAFRAMSKRAMHPFLRIGALFIAGLSISHGAGQVARADAISDKKLDRVQFIAVTRIVQLPAEKRAEAVPQLYQLLGEIPRNRILVGDMFYSSLPWRTPDHEKLTPEAQADLVEQQSDTQYLSGESGQLACRILREYPAQTTDLLRADLRADDATRQLRGLSNLAALRTAFGLFYDAGLPEKEADAIPFASFYPEIARIFQSAPPAEPANEFGITIGDPRDEPALKTQAESALIRMGRADTIALLIADDAAQPLLHYEAISTLARRNPDDAALQILVPFLKSGDAILRYRALYALPFALPAVRAALPILIDDSDAQVRERAVAGAFQFEGPEFAALEARLKSKLADASPRVRWMAADGFANRKNPIAAPVLLSLLRDQTPDVNSWAVADELYRLTGLNQNYDWPRDDSNNPDVARRNAEASARVEAWVAAHPA